MSEKGNRAELSKRGGQNSIRETRLAYEPDSHFTCAKPEEILFNDADCNLTAEGKRSLQEDSGEWRGLSRSRFRGTCSRHNVLSNGG